MSLSSISHTFLTITYGLITHGSFISISHYSLRLSLSICLFEDQQLLFIVKSTHPYKQNH